ncbi:MAG: 6-pyruvoyltetrahydropterin/6-carboxytetrahydropterin synthase [Phycisphaerales bacterium]|jgi:6-pyruvoyltetrahydropterin/6-carboxytetrahydropterin synthase
MTYRVCKAFEVESGHLLSKHPGRCRFPHGHSRRVEVVLAAQSLDNHDMVVDFKALKLALSDFLDSFDHAMAVNSQDPRLAQIQSMSERVIVFENEDPTTEAMARRIFDYLAGKLATGDSFTDEQGNTFALRPGVTLERVRVSETSSSWAEYSL